MRVLLAKVVMERTLFLAQLRLPAAAEAAVGLLILRVGVLGVAGVAREGLVVVPPLV